jgi:hypothetical protein
MMILTGEIKYYQYDHEGKENSISMFNFFYIEFQCLSKSQVPFGLGFSKRRESCRDDKAIAGKAGGSAAGTQSQRAAASSCPWRGKKGEMRSPKNKIKI